MSSSSRVRIAYRESGSTGPWIVIRRTGDSLTVASNTERSNEVRSDRTRGDEKVVMLNPNGSIQFELSTSNFDDFMAASLGNTWQTDTPTAGTDQLVNGTSVQRLDFLKSYLDTGDHVLISNAVISEMQLTMNSSERVTGEITVMGEGHDDKYDPNEDTFDEPLDSVILDSSNNLGSITIDGEEAPGICFTGLSLTISGGFQTDQCIGSLYQSHFAGSFDITGSVTLRMSTEGFDLWRKTTDSTPIALALTLSEGDNSYDISMPRDFLSGDLPSGGLDEILTTDLSLTAARDAEGVMMQIQRNLAA